MKVRESSSFILSWCLMGAPWVNTVRNENGEVIGSCEFGGACLGGNFKTMRTIGDLLVWQSQ